MHQNSWSLLYSPMKFFFLLTLPECFLLESFPILFKNAFHVFKYFKQFLVWIAKRTRLKRRTEAL